METGCFTSILWKRLATLTSHCMCYTNETYRTDKRALSDSYYSIINLTMQNINLIHGWFWWVLCFIFSTQTIRMWLTFYCYVFCIWSRNLDPITFFPYHCCLISWIVRDLRRQSVIKKSQEFYCTTLCETEKIEFKDDIGQFKTELKIKISNKCIIYAQME